MIYIATRGEKDQENDFFVEHQAALISPFSAPTSKLSGLKETHTYQ